MHTLVQFIRDKLKTIFENLNEAENEKVSLNFDNEEFTRTALTNQNKYYIWIGMQKNAENKNETRIYIFSADSKSHDEHWITVKPETINWDNYPMVFEKVEKVEQFTKGEPQKEQEKQFLLEAYIFDKSIYLVDILFPTFPQQTYTERRDLLFTVINTESFNYLTEYKSDTDFVFKGILPVFYLDQNYAFYKKLVEANFSHAKQLNCELLIKEKSLIKDYIVNETTTKQEQKVLTKTKFTEVYNVLDPVTRNQEGFLWIKKTETAFQIAEELKQVENGNLTKLCNWDPKCQKWWI